MSNGNKDLTRIEDLGEFLHELEDSSESEIPALPEDAEVPAWDNAGAGSWESSDEASTDTPADTSAFSLPDESPEFGEDLDFGVSELTDSPAIPKDEVSDFFEVEAKVEEKEEAKAEAPETHDWENFKPNDEDEKEIEEAVTPRENFQEVRDFAEKATFTEAPTDSNPAHSVLAHGVRFTEDADDILLVLKELNFPEDMMNQFRRQLERGTLLVPRVSEYTAIWLCHKLRRFRLELQSGLSDIIHPPRGAKDNSTGLVSRRSLGQNQHHQFRFEGDSDAARVIHLSTLPHLDGYVIERYIGVASEHALIPGEKVEDETDNSIHAFYDELAQKLKAHALDKRANAVVGVNYQLTPLPAEAHYSGQHRYRLTCTGNLVWVARLGK